MAKRLCSIEGCEKKHYGKGYCVKHWKRFKKYDDPLFIKYHNKCGTPTYYSWVSMKTRCLDTEKNYLKKGITVCDRWLNSFRNFYEDMGERPEGTTLDRINNNGDYEPNNCKWSTYEDQAKNRDVRADNKTGCIGVSKRKNKYRADITSKGNTYHLKEYKTFEEAVIARLKGEIKHWGYIKQTQFKHLLK